jgi:hypothetical protein
LRVASARPAITSLRRITQSMYAAAAPPSPAPLSFAHRSHRVCAHRLSDGARVSSTPLRAPSFAAAYPQEQTVFFSSRAPEGGYRVAQLRWAPGSRGSEGGSFVVASACLAAAGSAPEHRPLAVVPTPVLTVGTEGAPPLALPAFLVVGTLGSDQLTVLALPECALACVHTLEGVEVCGLAADRAGTALIVLDGASASAVTVPWPLPELLPPPA